MPNTTRQKNSKPTWEVWRQVAADERRWQNHFERGILKAHSVRDHILRLWFEEDLDVSIYELDFTPLFVEDNPGGVFEVLREPERFQAVTGDYSLIWLDPESGEYDEASIDLAPECVRFFCEEFGVLIKAPGEAPNSERIAA